MVHLIFLIAVVLAFSKYKDKKLFSVGFLLLIGFAVLRYDYGNDYRSYMYSYEAIRNHFSDPFEGEILYTYLNKIVPSFYLLIAIISIFFLYVIYKLINSNLKGIYKSLALLVFLINPYLFLMNLSAIRQCIAMCLFILCLKHIQERNLIKYVAFVVVATLFHTSALVLLPVYFIVNGKPLNKSQTVILVAGMLFLLVEGAVITEVVEVGLKFFNDSDYLHHFSQDASNSLRATLLTGVFFAYVACNLQHLNGYKLICGKLYLIGLLFGLLAFHYSMFTRIQMYFDIFSIITLPSIVEYHVENTEGKWQKIIHLYAFPICILVIYLARYYAFFTNPMWTKFGTYHTIFEALL